MENVAERKTEMIAQAKEVLEKAREREVMAQRITKVVKGTLAYGLREQGLTHKQIGEILGVSRNLVGELIGLSRNPIDELIKTGIWTRLFSEVPFGHFDEYWQLVSAVQEIFGPIEQGTTGWVHTRTGRSGRILESNDIPVPRTYRHEPGGLDTDAAQFDNRESGERILVYSLERHHGKVLFDDEMQATGQRDHRGEYRIELLSPASGARQQLPLELLDVPASDLRFGQGWPERAERNDPDDAFRNAIAAVRRHFGIWPLPAVTDDTVRPPD